MEVKEFFISGVGATVTHSNAKLSVFYGGFEINSGIVVAESNAYFTRFFSLVGTYRPSCGGGRFKDRQLRIVASTNGHRAYFENIKGLRSWYRGGVNHWVSVNWVAIGVKELIASGVSAAVPDTYPELVVNNECIEINPVTTRTKANACFTREIGLFNLYIPSLSKGGGQNG